MMKLERLSIGYQLVKADGTVLPIMMNGRQASFGLGWAPRQAIPLFDKIIVLVLYHSGGTETYWLLDMDACYVSNNIGSFDLPDKTEIFASIQSWLDQIVKSFFLDIDFANRNDVIEFFLLPENFRRQIAELVETPSFSTPEVSTLDEYESVSAPNVNDCSFLRYARRSIDLDIDKAYAVGCQSGTMSWPSPVDGLAVDDVRGIVTSHLVIVWRCVDRRNGITFFIIASGYGTGLATLWVPSLGRVIQHKTLKRGQILISNSNAHMLAVIQHVFKHGPALIQFMSKPVARLAHFTWPPPAVHIGHFHWNELSGIENIVNYVNPQDFPLIYDLGGAAGHSVYESISCLYPELRDNIEHSCKNFDEISNHSYRRGIQIVKFAGNYISAGIRARISNAIAVSGALESSRPAKNGAPVLVVGLRVENRTAVNLTAFYVSLAKEVVGQYGTLTLVIDGHNSRASEENAVFNSNLQQSGKASPLAIEHQICEEIISGLAGLPIEIVNCIGMTVKHNLFWMEDADLCVAPWGAGLAKYRWALNLPTYVLVSNHCRRYKADIAIYAGPEDMEAPTLHRFVDSAFVTDRPDLPVLFEASQNDKPYYANYEIDIEPAVSEVVSELRRLVPIPVAPG